MIQKKDYSWIGVLLFAAFFCLSFVQTAAAGEISYDRYAPVYDQPLQEPSTLHRISTGLLTYPFEPIRYFMDRSLYLIEKNHIDDKAIWLYDTVKNQGLTPKFESLGLFKSKKGLEADFVRIARQKQNLPDLTAQGYIHYAEHMFWNFGARAGFDRVMDTDFRAFTWIHYENWEKEHAYGIGPHTSLGEGGVYSREETTVGASVGFGWDEEIQNLDFKISYHNINLSEGRDGGRRQIRSLFGPTAVLNSDSLLDLDLIYQHDTRNHKRNSTSGGLRELAVGYREGLGSSQARFMHYHAEISQYLSLGSKRRVLAARIYGEHNDELNGGIVPFHQMPRLGGHGTANTLSQSLRGFDTNRFTDESALLFNLEYRYAIWEYRDFRLDAVMFFDVGQVFSEVSRFQFGDFRESYGTGFRLGIANFTILSLEAAHGDEGTQFYVRSETPF
ncbi:MAG: BamA/TamA family outer membrane protein [Candidatus Omnitrophica bacterium]|nr:BamA/TamA family outer membrane protein [Candidatus Omnitrophota bacterium]